MLFPLAVVYGAITAFRNYLFNKGWFKSVKFDFPVIGVGNLSMGGTGKSPHIEYLIFHLQYLYKVATLSRGYGRKSHGFVLANAQSSAIEIGDEPRQFKKKFPEAIVSVCEDRVMGVPKLLDAQPETEVILLDDAYQHRGIRPGLSILLTEYGNRFTRDHIFPLGWLREAKNNYHRADIIIVTKCPDGITGQERQAIISEIKPFRYQKVYFSSVQYGPLYSFYNPANQISLGNDTSVLLVCGIAKHGGIKAYLETKAANVYVRDYRDHHRFDSFDLENIRETFKNLGPGKKIIVTTEKDATRLEEHLSWFIENKIEIFVQPIWVKFADGDDEKIKSDVLSYIEHTRQGPVKINPA